MQERTATHRRSAPGRAAVRALGPAALLVAVVTLVVPATSAQGTGVLRVILRVTGVAPVGQAFPVAVACASPGPKLTTSLPPGGVIDTDVAPGLACLVTVTDPRPSLSAFYADNSGTATDGRITSVAGTRSEVVVILDFTGGAGRFNALSPARVLDTRAGVGRPGNQPPATAPFDVQLAGAGGVPASGVAAVVMNVTVTEPSDASFLALWPAGSTQPTVSSLNYTPGQTVANLVTVVLGHGGKVSVRNNGGTAHVIADVVGWYSLAGGGGAGLNPQLPARILDTRTGAGTPVSPAGRRVPIAGSGGFPAAGATAVVATVTATATSTASHLTVWPSGEAMPTASNLNYLAGATVPNQVIAKLGADGSIMVATGAGTADVVIDVVGYFSAAGGLGFVPATPYRDVDTRVALGNANPQGRAALFGVLSRRPDNVQALAVNLTIVQPSAASFAVVWPFLLQGSGPVPMPLASNLNFEADQTVATAAIVIDNDRPVPGAATGVYRVATGGPTAHLVVDVVGWFV